MFHTVGWHENNAVDDALTAYNALADQDTATNGDTGVVVPAATPLLIGVAALGITLVRAQVRAPSMREIGNLEVNPFSNDDVFDGGLQFMDLRRVAHTLTPGELLEMLFQHGAAADVHQGFCWLGSERHSAVEAPNMRTIRGTLTFTLTANVWSNGGQFVWDQALPAGRYAVLGFKPISATGIVARMVLPGSTVRPGAPCAVLEVDHIAGAELFRFGNFGVLGEFEHNRMPTFDFFASAGDTTQTVLLDLAKIG